jgi:hypothetical protein
LSTIGCCHGTSPLLALRALCADRSGRARAGSPDRDAVLSDPGDRHQDEQTVDVLLAHDRSQPQRCARQPTIWDAPGRR